MNSKSSSHHDEDSTQGSEYQKRIFDEIQRQAEEELQNSGRILNSAENSFRGSPKGTNICSNNASKISSRERSGRATREGSPAVRSGMDPMGLASYESSRLTPKYTSDMNYQGTQTAAFYFENYLKTGSPLPDYSHDVASSFSRVKHPGTLNVRFDDFIRVYKPLNESRDSCNQPPLCVLGKNEQISWKKNSFEIRRKKSFSSGSCQAFLHSIKAKHLNIAKPSVQTCSNHSLMSKKSYPSHSCIQKSNGLSGQLKNKSSLVKKTICTQSKQSSTSFKFGGYTPRMSKELKVCTLKKKMYCDQSSTRIRRCIRDKRSSSAFGSVCQIERTESCAPILDPCIEQPNIVLLPAPLRDRPKSEFIGKTSEVRPPLKHQGGVPQTFKYSKPGFTPELKNVQEAAREQFGRQGTARTIIKTGGNVPGAEQQWPGTLKPGITSVGSKFPAGGLTDTVIGSSASKKPTESIQTSGLPKTAKVGGTGGISDLEKAKSFGIQSKSNEKESVFRERFNEGDRSGVSKGVQGGGGSGVGGVGRREGAEGVEISGKIIRDSTKDIESKNVFMTVNERNTVDGVGRKNGTVGGGFKAVYDVRDGEADAENFGRGGTNDFGNLRGVIEKTGINGVEKKRVGFEDYNDVRGAIEKGGGFSGGNNAATIRGKIENDFRDDYTFVQGSTGAYREKDIGFRDMDGGQTSSNFYGRETGIGFRDVNGRGITSGFRDVDERGITSSFREVDGRGITSGFGSVDETQMGSRFRGIESKETKNGLRGDDKILGISGIYGEIEKEKLSFKESFRSGTEGGYADGLGKKNVLGDYRGILDSGMKEGGFFNDEIAEIDSGINRKGYYVGARDLSNNNEDEKSMIKSSRFHEMESKRQSTYLSREFSSQNQSRTQSYPKNVEFQDLDVVSNKVMPFNVPILGQNTFDKGQNELDRYSTKIIDGPHPIFDRPEMIDKHEFSYKTDKILGPINFTDKILDGQSPTPYMILKDEKSSKVILSSMSKTNIRNVTWLDRPNQFYAEGKTVPMYNETYSGQGNTGVSSPYQGSKKSGRSHLSGSPPPFASDSKSASKCPSPSLKSPRNFYEDFDLKPESPQYSKSHSRYTSSPGHVSECTDPIYESYGGGSKSPDRLAEISCRLSQGAADNISDLANNFPEASGQFYSSLGRASEGPLGQSDNFGAPSASSHPASEYSTQRFSPRSAQFSQSYGLASSQRMPEHISCGSEQNYSNVNESTGRMVQYSDVSGAFSQRSPGHMSECAAQFDEASNKHAASSLRFAESSAHQSEFPSSIRFVESSARQSEIAPNFSEHASHFSETSNRFNMSSTRFTESPGRISEPLSTIPESPGDFYGLPQPISDSYTSRSSEVRNGRGSKNCSEKAIKCLARLNSQSQDNWRNRSWDGENLCQYLTVCDPSYKPGTADRKLPKKPELSQKELQMLINNEANDVELTKFIMADDKKTFKKPCPKQAKAKMQIKQLINSMDAPVDPCPKNYGRLIEPDPEDISPDVAAAMMFSQEQGIQMESCPAETIKYLFPDEKGPCERIPVSKLSVVDSSQKDQDEMIERSANLPTEGLSDSAYTRLRKEQSEDIGSKISYELDFETAQGKREFVLVSRKSQRFNKIQYRGNDPSWFPGYFSAFPDEKGIKVVSSPSKVFNKAWMATNPGTMPLSDVTVIE